MLYFNPCNFKYFYKNYLLYIALFFFLPLLPILGNSRQSVDCGFQVLDSRFLVSGTWDQDSNRCWASEFLERNYIVRIPKPWAGLSTI